jgi:hypothetical protein
MGAMIAAVTLLLILWLLFVMAQFLAAPLSPIGLRVFQIRSNSTMADLLTYRVSVGPVVDADVVTRELSVYVDGADVPREVREYAPTVTDLGDVVVAQGSSVELRVVDIDDAGNRSEPAVLTFVAEDTLPPAQPGALGVTLVSETRVPDAVVTPEPEVTPDASDEV